MKNQRTKKQIPSFSNEDEERDFWAKNDSTEYIDWSKARRLTFSNLRPTSRSVSIRLPEMMIKNLKSMAHKRDVGYQSLIKTILADRIDQELSRK